jgi:hypothetical protein
MESQENPYLSPVRAAEAVDPPDSSAKVNCAAWGTASFALAMVFPLTFYGIATAETAGILGHAPPWGRVAVGAALGVLSLLAISCGIVSVARRTPNAWAVIGLVIGTFELFLMLIAG